MPDDPFHQSVSVFLDLGKEMSPGEINRIFKELGATLDYDVYSFDRPEAGPDWQSESYLDVELYCDDIKVDAQDKVDKIELKYPLATIGSEYISRFVSKAFELVSTFESVLVLADKQTDERELTRYCEALVTDLLTEWGEEPGSETLTIMIENSYQ